MNYAIRSVILLGVLTGFFLFIGNLIAGKAGMAIAFISASIVNFIAYWFSNKIVLRMYGAKEIPYEEDPGLHKMVEELAQRANIPKPKIYLVPMEQPNAFATGRGPSNGAVAITSGILKILNEGELRGVLAHEIGHIKNRDVLVATIAATIAGAISLFVEKVKLDLLFGGSKDNENNNNFLSFIASTAMIIITTIIATIIAIIIQMAISRTREYMADETGAKISGDPLALASALEKIHKYVYEIPVEVNKGTAHLFIENPLSGGGSFELFSTHPSTEKRIEKLKQLAREMGKVGV